ncbi:hypothetical protein MPAR168_11560 [Methylorubrum populi]|uniref:Uncharacterized protein n=1 Tax=Methylobacterium radiotolerans TaxID=31998 RepID=A0ABU7TE03_9HYPH
MREKAAEARSILVTQGLGSETVDPIPCSDFADLEIVSIPTNRPDHRSLRIDMSGMDHVIGRTDVVRATTKQALPSALPRFTAIRDGTRPLSR